MKNLVFSLLCVLFFNCIYAQQFAVFENNNKNKSLFDYNDPNSLVSMLLKNEDNIQDFFRESGGHFFTKSNSPQFVIGPATPMVIYRPVSQDEWIVQKSGSSYEQWLDSLLHHPDILRDDTGLSDYEALERWHLSDSVFLKSEWEAAFEGMFLKNKPALVGNYDLTNIDLIIVDSLDAYFGQKSLYENKHVICLKLPLYFLNSLYQIDYLPADVSKSIYEKLRSFQLMKKEQFKNDMDTGYELELYESNSYKGANQLFCYDEYTYSKLLKTNALKNVKAKELVIFRLVSQDEWIVQKSGSSYEQWLDSLLNHPDILRDDTGLSDNYMLELLHLNDSVFLKSAWEAAPEGGQLMDKDYIGNYWIEMPNYAMYLKRSFILRLLIL